MTFVPCFSEIFTTQSIFWLSHLWYISGHLHPHPVFMSRPRPPWPPWPVADGPAGRAHHCHAPRTTADCFLLSTMAWFLKWMIIKTSFWGSFIVQMLLMVGPYCGCKWHHLTFKEWIDNTPPCKVVERLDTSGNACKRHAQLLAHTGPQ